MPRHLPLRKSPPKAMSRWAAYGFLLITTVCWGASLIMVKPALDFTTPYRFLLYRYAIASVLSIGFIWHYWPNIKHKIQTLKTITQLELIGVTLTLGLLYQGLARTSAVEASLITTTVPVFITLGGIWFLREKQERHEWVGLFLALAGTFLITLWPAWQNSSLSQFSVAGNLLIVGQNITTAAYFILAKKYYQTWPKLFVASVSFLVGLVSFVALSLSEAHWNLGSLLQLIQSDWQHPAVWWASVYMAVFGSIIGLTAYIKGQSGVEASEASVFWYLEPLVYLPLAFWMLQETVQPFQVFGLSLILIGVTTAEWQRQRKTKNH